jgi:DNA polymerase III psi subunit
LRNSYKNFSTCRIFGIKQYNILNNSFLDFLLFVDEPALLVNGTPTKLQDNQKVVIVINTILEETEKLLLSKILKAIQVDMDQEATLLINGQFAGLRLSDAQPLNYLLLGVEPEAIQLKIHLNNYHSVAVHTSKVIKADSIGAIAKSEQLKRQLWTALQDWI